MQDRQNRTVARGIQELDSFPRTFQRPGFRLTVADHARDEQVRIVERCTECVRERIAKLATLVNGARDVRPGMTWDSARSRELAEQPLHPIRVLRHHRI